MQIKLAASEFLVLLALVVCCAADVSLAADDNPLRDFFPYGVYIGGNDPDGTVGDIKDVDAVRQAIEWACSDEASSMAPGDGTIYFVGSAADWRAFLKTSQ